MPPPVAVGGTPSQSWRLVFGAGAALWVASTIVLVLTDDDVLLPTVVLVGGFLVPVTVVQRESVASWTLPAPSTLSDPWLFSLVESLFILPAHLGHLTKPEGGIMQWPRRLSHAHPPKLGCQHRTQDLIDHRELTSSTTSHVNPRRAARLAGRGVPC